MNSMLNKNCIERASVLMKTPEDSEGYIVIKIKPSQRGCCCLHCWPSTWEFINKYIYPFGPLKHDGGVLIEKDNVKFVLECHESGPEIIICLGLISASISLVKTAIELVVAILKARQDEYRGRPCKFKIVKRYQIGQQFKEEEIMEIDLPLENRIIKKIEENIKVNLRKKNN